MTSTADSTYDEYQLHKEADEPHEHESDGCFGADLVELCTQQQRRVSEINLKLQQTKSTAQPTPAAYSSEPQRCHRSGWRITRLKASSPQRSSVVPEAKRRTAHAYLQLTLSVRLCAALHQADAASSEVFNGLDNCICVLHSCRVSTDVFPSTQQSLYLVSEKSRTLAVASLLSLLLMNMPLWLNWFSSGGLAVCHFSRSMLCAVM